MTLILLSKSTLSSIQCHRVTEHLNIPAKIIYESCRKEERKSGMSISLKTELLQRTQLMTGVDRGG